MNKINNQAFTEHLCNMNYETYENEPVLHVIKDHTVELFDEPTYALLSDVQMENGIIEVDVLSNLTNDAPDFARGFIGVAFRINEDHSFFESIYIRPTNGRVADMIRKSRAVQYFAYPNYKFDYLRENNMSHFETSADIGLNEWIHMKVVIEDQIITLYLNHQQQPTLSIKQNLVVPSKGAIGLWCDIGTSAYFKNLNVQVNK